MKSLDIYINCILDIMDKDRKVYKSRVQEVNKNNIVIDIPTENGEYLLLNKNDEIRAIIYNEKTAMLYKVKFTIIERKVENNLKLYKLTMPYEIKKLQRRNYVRVDVTKDIKYKTKSDKVYSDALALDLSGGGMKFKIDKKLELNDEIELIVELDGKFAKVKGEVRRISQDTKDKKYIVGYEFTEIAEIVREKIVEIVFSIMRRQIEVS